MATQFEFDSTEVWHPVGEATVYRLLPPDAGYSAAGAWPTTSGRFDLEDVPTLYLSRSPDGAVAEYFRRHPELLAFQESLKHELFRVTFHGTDGGADVTTEDRADAVGIPFERLTSSDVKNADRYAECRSLARETWQRSGCSIEYPSAAMEGISNVVGLGDSGWGAAVDDQIPLPIVDPAKVRPLPPGHEL